MRDKRVLSHKSDMARVPICLPSFSDAPASLTTISAGVPCRPPLPGFTLQTPTHNPCVRCFHRGLFLSLRDTACLLPHTN